MLHNKPTRVLICVDSSKATDIVLKESKQLLSQLPSLELYVFSVIDVRAVTVDQGYTMQSYQVQEAEMNNVKEAALENWPDMPLTFDYMFGNPADKILEYARQINCDLLVIGTHGRTGFDHLLFGSVAEQVLRKSGYPVLVIPVKHKL